MWNTKLQTAPKLFLRFLHQVRHHSPSMVAAIVFLWVLPVQGNAQAIIGPDIVFQPDQSSPLSKAESIEIQMRLADLGFDLGSPDGVLGGRTMAAWRKFLESRSAKIAGPRDMLEYLRASTAVRAETAAQPPIIAPCEGGFYGEGSLYNHVQAVQVWGDPIPKNVIDANRNGSWWEVRCRDSKHVESVGWYSRGTLTSRQVFSYKKCCETPIQIQTRSPDGKVQGTIHIGRTEAGYLTHIMGLDADGRPNRLIVITNTKKGTLWTMMGMDGKVLSRQYNDYWLSDLLTGLTVYRGSDFKHKYVYFLADGSLLWDAFDRYQDGVKIQEAKLTRDALGVMKEERIRLTSKADGTFYNRFYERGALVREEKNDANGNVYLYIRHNLASGGMVRSQMYRNDVLVGELRVVRSGHEPKETQFYLPDGSLYSVYPSRVVYFVDRYGEPRNGGPYSAKINRPLW